MALFEALGELVGAALISAAPAFEIGLSANQTAKYRELTPWLRAQADAGSTAADGIVDALARDIWVSTETRGLAQNAIENHALAVAELLIAYPPQAALLKQAIDRTWAGQGQTGASTEPAVRRIAVDVFGRARAGLGAQPTGLKDDVALLLIDRVYAHILDDRKVLAALAPALAAFVDRFAQSPGPAAAKAPAATSAAAAPTTAAVPASKPAAPNNPRAQAPAASAPADPFAALRDRFSLSDTALKRILALLDAQGVRADQMQTRLEELCSWIGEVRAQLQKPSNEDGELRKLKAKAAQALGDGDFETAAEALKQLRRDVREGRRQIEARLADEVAAMRNQMMEEARATARLAELALASQDFRQAADLFGEAALALPTTDRELAWQFGLQRADALYRAAEASEESALLNEAIAAYGHATRTVADGSNQRGLGQANLGLANALALAGQREAGTGRLKDATTTYRKTINLLSRETEARAWAMAELNLGRCLALIGEREGAVPPLREAAQAFRDALKELKPDRQLADFIAAQMGLGNALLALEEREGGTSLLTEAAAAYRAVIGGLSRDAEPEIWSNAQMNLGLALLGLGEQQIAGDHLQSSITAFRSALEETPRPTRPQKWALIQLNLGNALAALGDRDRKSPQRLDEAIAAYISALEEFSRETEPLKWAITQMNLGTAYIRLGDHRDKRRNWVAAAGALVPALEVFEAQGANAYADVTRQNLRRFHDSWEALIAAPGTTPAPAATQQQPGRARMPKAG